MDPTIETLNVLLALGGIACFLGAAVLAFDLYTNRALEAVVASWGMAFAFLLTLGVSTLTLVYSEIFGFVPCGLCWLQRIFLYPQVFILGTGLFIKEKTAVLYALVLSVPGFIIALYQHWLQLGGAEFLPCPAAGGDCARRILFEFGFMTFPLMSAGVFLLLIVLYFYILKTR